MFVRICRYRILPDLLDKYLSVQRRVSEIYQAHSTEHASYFQSAFDPCEWIEIHHYPDQAACQTATARINREPAIMALWQEFQQTLDPNFPPVIEEFHERGWFCGRSTEASARPAPFDFGDNINFA